MFGKTSTRDLGNEAPIVSLSKGVLYVKALAYSFEIPATNCIGVSVF